MHSIINKYCETHFHLLRMVLRSFLRRNNYWIIFIFLLHLEYKMTLNKVLTKSTSYDLLKSKIKWVIEFSVSKLRITWTKCEQN